MLMSSIQNLLENEGWLLRIEFDPNDGGDGPRVRIGGDTNAFRNLAAILTEMADKVDAWQADPETAYGWHLMFGGDMPQFELHGATYMSLDCDPVNDPTISHRPHGDG